MFANLVGLPTASITFLAVTTAISPYCGQGLPLLLGALAAWTTWFLFKAIDKQQEEKLLHPDPETWSVALPIAWGTLRGALGEPLKTERNLVHWQITHEDQSTGKMSAVCTFDDGSKLAAFITVSCTSDGTMFSRYYETNAQWRQSVDVIQVTERRINTNRHGVRSSQHASDLSTPGEAV